MINEKPKKRQIIPDHAKKVFKGVIFDVYHWEQEMFDGTFETFEKLRRADATQLIAITEEGKIIVTEEQQPCKAPYLNVPGGRIEEDENPLESAQRELLEETGYASGDVELLSVSRPYSKIDSAVHYFVARNCKKVAEQHLDAGEKISIRLVTFEEFVNMALAGKLQNKGLAFLMLENEIRTENNPENLEKLRRKIFK